MVKSLRIQVIRCISLMFFCNFLIGSRLCTAQVKPDFESFTTNEDIAILNEHIRYTFIGVKAHFLKLVIDRDVEFKILNEKGAKVLKQFTLPEPVDETYFVHAPDIRSISPLLDYSTVLSFEGEIVRSDKSTTAITNNPKIITAKTLSDKGFFGIISTYSFDIPNLQVGDIVKIRYKVSAPFENNIYALLISRFFFHRKYPVKSLDFSFSYDKALQADVIFNNNCAVSAIVNGGNRDYTWHFDNLPGCLDEEGSRPYVDLPWFSFHPKLNETLEYNFDSFEENYVKPWYLMTGDKEGKFEYYYKEYEQGINNQDNSGFNKVAKKFNDRRNDSLNNLRLWDFQKWMSDSTDYDPDTIYYQREESQLISKPGVDLYNGVVRDHSINNVYAAMIPRLGYSFLNAYIIDKRVGALSSKYFASLHENDLLFAVPINENVSYVLPASERNHYYFEELPFYYEDSPVILIHYSDFKGYKRNYYDSLRVVNTPGSMFSENLRNVSSMVDINTATMSMSFSTRLILSGQYSTLTRNLYLGNLSDNTINPLYHRKIWEIGGIDKPGSYSIVGNEYVFPYKTTVKANYTSKAIKKEEDNTFEIDVADWFLHAIYPEFTSANRTTAFYPDFMGSDKYFYLLTFDKDIEITDAPVKINLENSMGTYTFNLVQNDKNKILITSYFVTKSNKVPVTDIAEVEQMYNAVKSRKEFKIKFKIVN